MQSKIKEVKRINVNNWDLAGKIMNIIANGSSVKDVRIPRKKGIDLTEAVYKIDLKDNIKKSQTHEDLDYIGDKIHIGLGRGYNLINEQYLASKKMREIYDRIGKPQKGKRTKVKRSELE